MTGIPSEIPAEVLAFNEWAADQTLNLGHTAPYMTP